MSESPTLVNSLQTVTTRTKFQYQYGTQPPCGLYEASTVLRCIESRWTQDFMDRIILSFKNVFSLMNNILIYERDTQSKKVSWSFNYKNIYCEMVLLFFVLELWWEREQINLWKVLLTKNNEIQLTLFVLFLFITKIFFTINKKMRIEIFCLFTL